MFRKKSVYRTDPMPKKQFRRIINSFERHGGKVLRNKEAEERLARLGVEASTINDKTVIFSRHPSRAAVFEEFIHVTQYKLGENDGSYFSTLKCEIEAKEKLLKNKKQYKLTEQEIKDTYESLKRYQKDLDDYLRGGKS